MDFTSALMYPFKSIARVATIVLVFTIASAVFLGMILNSFDWLGWMGAVEYSISNQTETIPFYGSPGALFIPGIFGFFLVLIVEGFWLSGYSIRVVRHVMDGFEKLPDTKIGKDLLNGFYLFVAGIMYSLLFVPFIIIVGMLMVMSTGPDGNGGLAGLVFCSSFIVAIPLLFLLYWSYHIGLARFAADNTPGALFQVRTNVSIARHNVKASLGLSGFQFLLGLTFWFVSQFINNALNLVMTPFIGNSFDETGILTIFVVFLIVSVAMNIFQQFSNMHLIAQYAQRIGIYDAWDDIDFVK